jgi:hypothetical protein
MRISRLISLETRIKSALSSSVQITEITPVWTTAPQFTAFGMNSVRGTV